VPSLVLLTSTLPGCGSQWT